MQQVTLWRILTNQYWWSYIHRSPFVHWSFSDLIEQINLLEIKAKTELGLEAHVLGRWKRGRRPPETAKYLFAEMLSIARQQDTLSKFGIVSTTDDEAVTAALEVAQIWSALKDPSFSTWEPTYTWLTHFKQEMAQWLYAVIGTVTQRGAYQDELEAEQ